MRLTALAKSTRCLAAPSCGDPGDLLNPRCREARAIGAPRQPFSICNPASTLMRSNAV